MSQIFQILLSDIAAPVFTGITTSLTLNNDYYSYDQSGLNQGIVTEFNVLQYLNDPKNAIVSNNFFDYLDTNTTPDEFAEITQSNSKLATVFQQYYATTVILSQKSPVTIVDAQLSGTSAMTLMKYYDYNLQGVQVVENSMTGTPASLITSPSLLINHSSEELISYTTEISYYLPVKIKMTVGESSIVNFSAFSSDEIVESIDSNGNIQKQFLKQGFVDLNNQDTSDSFWTNSGATIGFSSNTFAYNSTSGAQTISIYLSEPSSYGSEQISLFYDGDTTIVGSSVGILSGSTTIYLKNGSSSAVTNPLTINFPIGSSQIDLIVVPNEGSITNILPFDLNINSIQNGIPGEILDTKIQIFP